MKPAYFPMSDTEDNEMAASEPYSSEYHKKMANRPKPLILDAVHDDTAIDSFDAPSSSRSGVLDNQPPMMLISSVRSLNSLQPPTAENSSSFSDSQDSAQRHHRKMFGIAKINPEPSTRPNRNSSSRLLSLLKEVDPPQHAARKIIENRATSTGVARSRKPKLPNAVSKIGKLRKAFDHVYKGRIHSQGPVMEERRPRMASRRFSEIIAAAAKSSDDESEEEEEDDVDQSDENSSPHYDSSRSSTALTKQSMARTKVTQAPPAAKPLAVKPLAVKPPAAKPPAAKPPAAKPPAAKPAAAKPASFAIPPVTGSSRRKTAHKPLANDDDIMFVDVGGTVVTVGPRSSVSSKLTIPGPSTPQNRTRSLSPPVLSPRSIELQGVRAIENPNADLIKKVAFLRCCVNYMMFELNRKPYSFHRYSNLGYLTSRYKQNKIINQTKK